MAEETLNAFAGKKAQPADDDLTEVLGATKPVWDRLIADLAADYGVTVLEWKSVKTGWSVRLLRKKRPIVWLSPYRGYFRVSFVLGEKAVVAARECGLPARVRKALDEAPKYPEGTGLRLVIKGQKDIAAVKKLAAVKIAN